MDFNDVIDLIGNMLDKTLIVNRSIVQHPTIKIFKTFKASLYELKDKKPVLLKELSKTQKVSQLLIDKGWDKFNKYVLTEIFKMLKNGEFSS